MSGCTVSITLPYPGILFSSPESHIPSLINMVYTSSHIFATERQNDSYEAQNLLDREINHSTTTSGTKDDGTSTSRQVSRFSCCSFIMMRYQRPRGSQEDIQGRATIGEGNTREFSCIEASMFALRSIESRP